MRHLNCGLIVIFCGTAAAEDAVEFLLSHANSVQAAVRDGVARLSVDGFQFWVSVDSEKDLLAVRRLRPPNVIRQRKDADLVVTPDVTREGRIPGFSIYETRTGGLLADQAVDDARPETALAAVVRHFPWHSMQPGG